MNEFERYAPAPRFQNNSQNGSQNATAKPATRPTNDVAASGPYTVQRLAQALRDFDDIGAEVQPAVRPQPTANDVAQMLLKNATVLQNAREYRLAMNLLRTLLIRTPDHLEGLLRMGECLREEGRFEEALKCFRALAKHPTARAEAQLLVAGTLYLCERDQMSLGAYREALKFPIREKMKLFEAYKNMGNIHVRAGDYEAAEEFYNKAYVLYPESDVLMVNYGTLEIQRENLSNAVERFRRAVEVNAMNDKAWVGLALVHRQMGDLELSWANVQRALDINQTNRTAIRLVVEWGVADNDFTVPVRRLQDYLEAEGEDAEMSFTLAKIFTHLGRLSEARLELERVLALDCGLEGAVELRSALERELHRAACAQSESVAARQGSEKV